MMNKSILYFCSSCLDLRNDGIQRINRNLVKEFLKNDYRITIIMPEGCNKEIFQAKNIDYIEFRKRRSILGTIIDLAKLRPLFFNLYFDRRILKAINKENYRIIFYDFYPLCLYSSGQENEIILMPDSLKLLMLSGFKNESSFLKKIYYLVNFFLAGFYNKRIKNINKLYVSEFDISFDKLPKSFFFQLPIDSNHKEIKTSETFNPNEIVFRGGLKFEPNFSALLDFYENFYLQVLDNFPETKLKVVGEYPANQDSLLNFKYVSFTGFVDDDKLEMSKSGIQIVPMISGSGVKNKMLDAMVIKRLVFCTPISINGIFSSIEEARKNGIVVYENLDEFLHFYSLYKNQKINYQEQTEKAYQYVLSNSYAKKIIEIENIIK